MFRPRIASRCRGVDQRLLDAITCEWKCADPWKPGAEATGGKANMDHLSRCQQFRLTNSAVHGHRQVVRLVSGCGMGPARPSRLQRTPFQSTAACQAPPWWPGQGQRQKARKKVGTAKGGSQWTIPPPIGGMSRFLRARQGVSNGVRNIISPLKNGLKRLQNAKKI